MYITEEIWQRCPICLGSGEENEGKCTVCGGQKIISKLTGQPPLKTNTTYYPSIPDTQPYYIVPGWYRSHEITCTATNNSGN